MWLLKNEVIRNKPHKYFEVQTYKEKMKIIFISRILDDETVDFVRGLLERYVSDTI